MRICFKLYLSLHFFLVLSSHAQSQNSKSVSTLKAVQHLTMNTTIALQDSILQNRIIKIAGDNLSSDHFLFKVNDRWGSEVYSSSSLNHMMSVGWDGRKEENFLPHGNFYTYSLSCQDKDGNSIEQKGFITITN